jgi:hypothetical protein
MKNPILPLLFSSRGTHIPCFPRSPTRNPVLREDQISINMGNFHLAALKSRALRPQKNYKIITKLQYIMQNPNYSAKWSAIFHHNSKHSCLTTFPLSIGNRKVIIACVWPFANRIHIWFPLRYHSFQRHANWNPNFRVLGIPEYEIPRDVSCY